MILRYITIQYRSSSTKYMIVKTVIVTKIISIELYIPRRKITKSGPRVVYIIISFRVVRRILATRKQNSKYNEYDVIFFHDILFIR